MEEMRKELQPAEVYRRGVCVSADKRLMFPPPGEKISVTDEQTGSTYDVVMGSQHRLCIGRLYDEHKDIRPVDVVVFQKRNGKMAVSVTPRNGKNAGRIGSRHAVDPSHIQTDILDVAMDVLTRIENKTMKARVTMREHAILIEWGDGVADSEVVVA